MYYIWDRTLYGNKKAFICELINFDDTDNLVLHNEENNIPTEGLTYNAYDNMLEPEDYPYTGTIFNFLVSDKIVEILRQFNFNIQYFPSKIIRDDGVEMTNYQTLNILSEVYCTDLEKSVVKRRTTSKGIERIRIKKLILDETKIPDNEKLFWLGEESTWLVVHQDIVDCLEKADVTGIRFIPVEEFNCM